MHPTYVVMNDNTSQSNEHSICGGHGESSGSIVCTTGITNKIDHLVLIHGTSTGQLQGNELKNLQTNILTSCSFFF